MLSFFTKRAKCACCENPCDSHSSESSGFNAKREFLLLAILIALFLISIALLHFFSGAKIPLIALLVGIYAISGKDIIFSAFRNLAERDFFSENVLMFIATVAAFAIGAFEEAVAVMLFYRTGEFLQEMAVNNSKKSIKSLLQIAPNIAHVRRNSQLIDVAPNEIQIGEIFLVRPWGKNPA